MSISILISFSIGALFGGGVGVWLAKRKEPASVFTADAVEANVLRAESHKVVHARIERSKARIVEIAKKEGRVTNDGVEDMFCIGDRTSGRYLKQLTAEGKLIKVGTSGRGVYYTPKN